jgi:hypothetical protein
MAPGFFKPILTISTNFAILAQTSREMPYAIHDFSSPALDTGLQVTNPVSG